MKHIFVIILSILLLAACGESGRNRQLLNRAEAMMEDSCEVALSILQDSIDTTTLNTERGRAIYAVLLSQALDKNYIDLTSDSIIAPAVEYFADGNEPHYAMLTHYYYGKIFYNMGNQHNAITQYTCASNFINCTTDTLTHGLINTQLGNLYSESCDFPKSIEAYLKAYNFYKSAKNYHHKIHALYDASCSYRGNQDYTNAYQLISQVISEANDSCDYNMIKIGYEELILQLINQNKFSQALTLYDSLTINYPQFYYPATFHSFLATAFAFNKNSITAKYHITKAWENATDINDSIIIYINSSNAYRYLGDNNNAFLNLSNGTQLEKLIIRKELEQPLLTAQRNLLAQNLEISHYKQRLSTYVIIIIVLISLTTISLIISFSYKLIHKKQQIINDYTETILELRDSVKYNKSSHAKILNELFETHFSILNNIGNTLVDISDNTPDQKRLYKEIKGIIAQFEKPQKQIELEQLINRYKNNLMQKLRVDFPNFSNDEFQQIRYHYVGFSPKFISLLMHQKYPTIYKRRSRLKEKIESSNSLHKDDFLSNLR